MPTNATSFELITRYREDEGITRTEFAARLGVDSSTVARWETGKATPTGTAALVLRAVTAKYRTEPRPAAASGSVVPAIGIPAVAMVGGLFGMLQRSLEEYSSEQRENNG